MAVWSRSKLYCKTTSHVPYILNSKREIVNKFPYSTVRFLASSLLFLVSCFENFLYYYFLVVSLPQKKYYLEVSFCVAMLHEAVSLELATQRWHVRNFFPNLQCTRIIILKFPSSEGRALIGSFFIKLHCKLWLACHTTACLLTLRNVVSRGKFYFSCNL